MVKTLALAFRWREMQDTGMHATLEDRAESKGIRKTYASQLLCLTLLAPEIVKAILAGRQPAEQQRHGLLAGFLLEWQGQRKCLATLRPSSLPAS
jgi:hypothetical protein